MDGDPSSSKFHLRSGFVVSDTGFLSHRGGVGRDMYGSFVLVERSGKFQKAKRVYLGNETGRNEAWLRDRLFENPEIIPVDEIDPAFAPLVPLCKELRTAAGNIDATFVSESGRLTIVECKLWKNPEARREVVAQALDYVSALSRWTYADLQQRVSAALGKRGNGPYELIRERLGTPVREEDFVNSVGQSLREGRILVLIAGEGIRESVQALIELFSRNPTLAFKFGLVEVATYQVGDEHLLMQPRVLAQTQIIGRQVVVINTQRETVTPTEVEVEPGEDPPVGGKKDHLKVWWQPVLEMKFDDKDQESPF